MLLEGPVRGAIALAMVLVMAAGIGRVIGVGPFAGVVPPDQVRDPGEMIARSLQVTFEAASVHVEGRLEGSLPGSLLERDEPFVDLAGTAITADLRPRDARTQTRVAAPALGVEVETITVWTTAWYRDAGGPWRQVPVADATSGTGVDLNPLTLVDRLRSYLATVARKPTSIDVACASASGRCHEIRLDAGADPAAVLAGMLPGAADGSPPVISTVITLQTDALTLRPAALSVVAASADETLDLRLTLVFGGWDGPVRIDEPPAGDVSPG